ncbi:sugar phosphate isomerase/epimerase [Mucilaginibacter sp. dw_454]|uniref:sugar phosphate isomerase/epimerase n=1 Tax=Mucilaginibacter sp. dw_454 TaxID=2720079 RepID=UPI001BD4742C|nr:sugar phosphate isomerase/epimerase [Mucilaginibacter sp. dw_454]
MKVKILSPQWGHEQMPLLAFLDKIRDAGYDGIDTWIPENTADKRILFDYLQANELYMISHQHRAQGNTFAAFKASFVKELHECAGPGPLLINSHTGKDYFSLAQNLELIDAAQEFSAKTGITVAHETHRGRFGYSPQITGEVFKLRPDLKITADFSHWTCVTESMLENFEETLDEAIKRSIAIHARIGFEEGPQVADPFASEWRYALDKFLGWWDSIVAFNAETDSKILPITTEFGPEPYMPKIPFSKTPMVNQFAINCAMKDLLVKRYAHYR